MSEFFILIYFFRGDIEEINELFFDAKASAKILQENSHKFIN